MKKTMPLNIVKWICLQGMYVLLEFNFLFEIMIKDSMRQIGEWVNRW